MGIGVEYIQSRTLEAEDDQWLMQRGKKHVIIFIIPVFLFIYLFTECSGHPYTPDLGYYLPPLSMLSTKKHYFMKVLMVPLCIPN